MAERDDWIEQWTEPLSTTSGKPLSVKEWRRIVRDEAARTPDAVASVEAQENLIKRLIDACGIVTDGAFTPRMIARDELSRMGVRP